MKAVENMLGKRALVTGIGSSLALAITARGYSRDACKVADASPGSSTKANLNSPACHAAPVTICLSS